MGIDEKILKQKRKDIVEAFTVRNQIIHELDVRPSAAKTGQRQRNSRTRDKLESYSKLLLQISDHFVKEVDKKLDEHA